jgi:anti-sigma regulatory factor (Ser/Thr protein kinase)
MIMPQPRSENTVILDIPATRFYLDILGSTAAKMLAQIDGLDRSSNTIYNIQIVLNELSANIANHAYRDRSDGRIIASLSIMADPIRFTAILEDQGKPLPEIDLGIFLSQPAGNTQHQGLTLIQTLVDNLEYTRQNNQNQWRLVKNL